MFEHLAATADQWWIAEDEATGRAVGYARSILRDGVRELTEFFVLPDAQSAGVGRGLLERAFPADGRPAPRDRGDDRPAGDRPLPAGRARRARADDRPRGRSTRMRRCRPTSCASRIDPAEPPLDELADDRPALLGFRRDEDHRWLATSARAGSTGAAASPSATATTRREPLWGGPYAALDAADLPVLLADGEAAAAAAGHATVTFDVALTARPALDHLLGRGFRVDPFVMLFFTDGPVDGLDRYVLTSPPFFA